MVLGDLVRLNTKNKLGSRDEAQFSQDISHLTQCRLVGFDEVSEKEEISAANIKGLCPGIETTIELKRENPIQRTVVGNALLMGFDYPSVNTNSQGIRARMSWIHWEEREEGLPYTMRIFCENSEHFKAAFLAYMVELMADIINNDAIPDERYKIVYEGAEWAEMRRLGCPVVSGYDQAEEFYSAKADPVAAAVRDLIEPVQGLKLSTAQAKQAVKEYGISVSGRGDEVKKAVEEAFSVEAKMVKIDGKSVKGWHGLRLISEMEEE